MPPATWSIPPDPTLPGLPPVILAYAALHPARGIALIDLAPASTPNAVQRLRNGLAMIGFAGAYPGYLPVIQIQIDAFDRTTLTAHLDAVFQAEPPITLGADPETLKWPAMALRVLGMPEAALLPAFMPSPMRPPPVRLDIRPSHQPAVPRRTSLIAAAVLAPVVLGAGLLVYSAAPSPVAAPPPPLAVTPISPAPSTPMPLPAPAEPTPSAFVEAPPPVAAPAIEAPLLPTTPEPLPTSPTLLLPSSKAPSPRATLLLKRGDEMLSQHDLPNARRFYELAFAAGDGCAAVSVGQTYAATDQVKAAEWYGKARASGDPRVEMALKFVRAAQSTAPATP